MKFLYRADGGLGVEGVEVVLGEGEGLGGFGGVSLKDGCLRPLTRCFARLLRLIRGAMLTGYIDEIEEMQHYNMTLKG